MCFPVTGPSHLWDWFKSIRQRRIDGAINSEFQRYYNINTGCCNSDLLLKDPDQDFG